jgi:hypothetical protein
MPFHDDDDEFDGLTVSVKVRHDSDNTYPSPIRLERLDDEIEIRTEHPSRNIRVSRASLARALRLLED